jgi:hypothetical protein
MTVGLPEYAADIGPSAPGRPGLRLNQFAAQKAVALPGIPCCRKFSAGKKIGA